MSNTYADLIVNSVELHKDTSLYTSNDAVSKSYVDQKVSDLVSSAPEILDTLAELAAALGSDANFATTVATQISGIQSNLDAEITRATAAESAFQTQTVADVSAEATARAQADVALSTQITQEADTRSQEDVALSTQITQEISDRTTALSAEASIRLSRDDEIASDLSILGSTLSSQIVNEQTARATAVQEEATARQQGDDALTDTVTTLYTDITTEQTARIADVSALTTNIGNLDAQKLDKSNMYEKTPDGHFKVAEDSFLYIGNSWRIRGNNAGGPKKLQFEYSNDGGGTWVLGVPFVRSV